jgi:hypothetical protein
MVLHIIMRLHFFHDVSTRRRLPFFQPMPLESANMIRENPLGLVFKKTYQRDKQVNRET